MHTSTEKTVAIYIISTTLKDISETMSRFWAAGSSSESEQDSGSDSDSSGYAPPTKVATAGGRFAMYDSDSGE